jgi:hypothetical protein
VGLGVLRGAPVVEGADSYGYVSQARLWATGTLRVEHPLIGNLPEGIAAEVVAPLGYRLSTDGTPNLQVRPASPPIVRSTVVLGSSIPEIPEVQCRIESYW